MAVDAEGVGGLCIADILNELDCTMYYSLAPPTDCLRERLVRVVFLYPLR